MPEPPWPPPTCATSRCPSSSWSTGPASSAGRSSGTKIEEFGCYSENATRRGEAGAGGLAIEPRRGRMKRRLLSARLVLGTLAAGGLLAAQVPVSRAECNWGVIYLTRKNASSVPVWGPGCIAPDDGTWGRIYTDTGNFSTPEVPDGTPNGYFYDVVVTTP